MLLTLNFIWEIALRVDNPAELSDFFSFIFLIFIFGDDDEDTKLALLIFVVWQLQAELILNKSLSQLFCIGFEVLKDTCQDSRI